MDAPFVRTGVETRPTHSRAADLARPIAALGRAVHTLASHGLGLHQLIVVVAADCVRLLAAPARAPWREISATIHRAGTQAIPASALVCMLFGVALSSLAAQELRNVGADTFLVNLIGVGVLRELSPLLVAILNAGRSGSAMTAEIGLMRMSGELAVGSPMSTAQVRCLVVPKVLGQMIALPLVVVFTDAVSIAGGMFGANFQLGIPYDDFLARLPESVPIANLWLGIGKAAVFGALIALVACHFGLRIRADARGIAAGTARAVVTALTLVLLTDAVFAVLFSQIGL